MRKMKQGIAGAVLTLFLFSGSTLGETVKAVISEDTSVLRDLRDPSSAVFYLGTGTPIEVIDEGLYQGEAWLMVRPDG